jgi:hypothetical protein
MWVDVTLKCPEEGEWFALTRVTAGGETTLIVYLTREDVEKANDGSANFDLLGAVADEGTER